MNQTGRRAAMAVSMVVWALIAGCTKRNPEACCVTRSECEALGFPDAPAPCDDGVCVGLACVASGCDDDGDCAAVDGKPRCVSGQCYGEVEACRDNGGAAIAFSSTRDGATALYRMYANGSGVKKLSELPIGDAPAPAFDGRQIGFIGFAQDEPGLFVVDIAGGTARSSRATV